MLIQRLQGRFYVDQARCIQQVCRTRLGLHSPVRVAACGVPARSGPSGREQRASAGRRLRPATVPFGTANSKFIISCHPPRPMASNCLDLARSRADGRHRLQGVATLRPGAAAGCGVLWAQMQNSKFRMIKSGSSLRSARMFGYELRAFAAPRLRPADRFAIEFADQPLFHKKTRPTSMPLSAGRKQRNDHFFASEGRSGPQLRPAKARSSRPAGPLPRALRKLQPESHPEQIRTLLICPIRTPPPRRAARACPSQAVVHRPSKSTPYFELRPNERNFLAGSHHACPLQAVACRPPNSCDPF